MRNRLIVAALAATLSASAVTAQDRRDDGNYNRDQGYSNHDSRYRHDYRTRSGYQDCRRSKGTTGTIAGAVGGGVLGNVLGGGTLGTLAGAGGGALVGRTLDRNHDRAQNRHNGC